MGLKMISLFFMISIVAAQPLETTVSSLYYYELDNSGFEELKDEKIIIRSSSTEDRIYRTMTHLLENDNNKITCIPKNVKVSFILMMHGYLELEFSEEILNYGGTMCEAGMLNQILATLFSIEEVEKITLYIQGHDNIFVEGAVVNEYTRDEWQERKCTIWQE